MATFNQTFAIIQSKKRDMCQEKIIFKQVLSIPIFWGDLKITTLIEAYKNFEMKE